MAYNSGSRSERLLQGRRFTTDGLTLTQEAFADVFDLGAGEIYTDDGLIPTGSSQLPYSGSTQDGGIISGSVVNPSIETDIEILKFYYRHALKGAADSSREIYYFTTSEPSTHDDYVEDDQRIEADQETNFISPKYIIPTHAARNAENITPGYKVAISYGSNINSVTAATDDQYVFDYKTGILTWVGTPPHGSTDFVFATIYQYVGRTLRSQIDDGSIGGGSDFTAAGISGSLGPNADLIRSLTATSISGSFTEASSSFSTRVTTLEGKTLVSSSAQIASDISGSTRFTIAGQDDSFTVGQDDTINFISGSAGITVLSNSSDTITIGASTDDVTFNSVTSDTLTGTASFADKVAINQSNLGSNFYNVVVSNTAHTLANNDNSGRNLQFNGALGQLQIISPSNANSFINIDEGEFKVGTSITEYDLLSFSTALATINFGTKSSLINIGDDTAGDKVVFGNDVFVSGSLNASTDLSTFDLLNTNTTTINFGGAATTLNIGNAAGTVNIAGSASIAGDLTVQGTVTSIQTENLNVSDQFILLASGSTGTTDGGIIVQSGSNGVGTALYFDANANRWAVNPANTVNWDDTALTPKQYVVSVSASATAPPTDPLDFGNTNEYYGMMHVNTDNGDIYIYS